MEISQIGENVELLVASIVAVGAAISGVAAQVCRWIPDEKQPKWLKQLAGNAGKSENKS